MLLLLTQILSSQEKYALYNSSYDDNIYEIQIHHDDNNYTLYVYMLSLERLSDTGGIRILSNQHTNFLTALNNAKLKYKEWSEIAIENNVEEVVRNMDYNSRVRGFFLYGRTWHLVRNVNLRFEFRVIDNKPLLLIRTGRLTSSSNRYINHDGFVIVFQNIDEIDDFINILTIENIQEFINKPRTIDLFE